MFSSTFSVNEVRALKIINNPTYRNFIDNI